MPVRCSVASMLDPDAFAAWYTRVEQRYQTRVTFSECRRALQALSAIYVHRRDRLGAGAALDGEGKRAAFGCFYGPLHFLMVGHIVESLGLHEQPLDRVVDLGCGTGAAGAAWALALADRPAVSGVDVDAWAAREATWTYGSLGLRGEGRKGNLLRERLPGARAGIVLGFAVNELEEHERAELLRRLIAAHREGASVLIVEPIAKRALPWWSGWSSELAALGGRADEWRFRPQLPERLRLLDKAAGLRHDELTGRSLALITRRA